MGAIIGISVLLMPSTQAQSISEKLLALPLGRAAKDFLNYLTVEACLSENTILAYGRDLKNFLDHCKSNKISQLNQIKPVLIQNYQRNLTRENKDERVFRFFNKYLEQY